MLDIITVGTATRDVFLASRDFKVLKDPKHLDKLGFPKGEAACFALGSKLEIKDPVFTTGGGAANAAVSFSRLGFKTAACMKLGDDDSGKAVLAELKSEGVKPIVSFSKDEGTAYSTVLLTPGGERTILIFRGAGEHVTERDLPLSSLKAKWAYLAPGKIPVSLLEKAVLAFKKKGMKIALNPSRGYLTLHNKKIERILRSADVVLVNREEAAYLTGVSYHREEKLMKSFFGLFGEGIAVITEDKKGAVAFDGAYVYRVGIFEDAKMVDETGAGDAFGAGFVSGLMEMGDILYALRLGSANAASVIEHMGGSTGALTKKEFKKSRWENLPLDIDEL